MFRFKWVKFTHLPFRLTTPRSHVEVFETFVKAGQ